MFLLHIENNFVIQLLQKEADKGGGMGERKSEN